jgi:NAD(P)-dependent dehydrogenase (short-subunit alcohol dehydrogenase family)
VNKAKKVMLITGASGGMGSAMVKHFAKGPYQLVLHYHTNHDRLKKLIEEEPFSFPPIVMQADLYSEEAIIHLCGEAQRLASRVDILINNAGMSSAALTWKQDLANWNDVINLNLTAPFLMMKHLIPGMRHRGFGRIVNISSVVAQIGVVGASAYAASKAGLFGLAASASKELASKGITVNTIALGYMDDGMINLISEDVRKSIVDGIPLGRLGDSESLGALIAYLASEDAQYLTGQILNFNGGMYGG